MGAAHRTLVTGLGVLCPVGRNREELRDAVATARRGLAPIRAFDPSPFRTPYGGEVPGPDPGESLPADERELLPDRYMQLALVAARQALADAGLDWSPESPPGAGTGLVVGTCNGGLKTAEQQYRIINGLTDGVFDRRMVLLIRYHALAKALCHCLGISGPSWVVTTACSASTGALGVAEELIGQGVLERALVGGADALCLAAMAGFDALKATADGTPTAPFSLPVGLNLGEGAAFWVLEQETVARGRGARIDGELLGYALTSDAHHPTAPDPRGDGAFRTMSGALERAGIEPADIGCVNAHGTGTEANDRAESRAIARLAGDLPLPAYSFKSQVGHCLGAAGIIEATAGLLAMTDGLLPATAGFGEPRPGCGLDYVADGPRPAEYDRFVSCNYAFGGNNAGVVVGLHDPERPPPLENRGGARAVLTGGGAVTSLGLGAPALLEALRDGRRGIAPVGDRVRGETTSLLAGLVPELNSRQVDRRLDLRPMKPIGRYATAAARLALGEAGLRVGPRDGLITGVINGVYVGPSEEDHMEEVTRDGGAGADIAGFSQIVANSTAGWVSNALMLKGYTTTVAQGADAGLYALALGHLAVRGRSTTRVLAGAADELYSRYYHNQDDLGLLYTGDDERRYELRLDVPDRRVLGEGAAYVVVEELAAARARGARPLAEVVGLGMTTDGELFYEPNPDPDGLARAVEQALAGAGWRPEDVGLVLWSPQGNMGDSRVLQALGLALGGRAAEVPYLTSVFHTGLAESASGTATLAAMLRAWAAGEPLWPQITGVPDLDDRPLPDHPVPVLALATSDHGLNLALAIAPFAAGEETP